ncbi:MAG: hypothetical protein JEZ12_20650 [Desulfobacterium sp.]|nr:hypothetical protein [Desulfobacterium sp.]
MRKLNYVWTFCIISCLILGGVGCSGIRIAQYQVDTEIQVDDNIIGTPQFIVANNQEATIDWDIYRFSVHAVKETKGNFLVKTWLFEKNKTKDYRLLTSPEFVTEPGMSAQMETGTDSSTDYRIKVTVTEK